MLSSALVTGGRNPMRFVQAEVRRICRGAGLPDDISFTSFRHAATPTMSTPD
jgi:hypothetical protein